MGTRFSWQAKIIPRQDMIKQNSATLCPAKRQTLTYRVTTNKKNVQDRNLNIEECIPPRVVPAVAFLYANLHAKLMLSEAYLKIRSSQIMAPIRPYFNIQK